MSIFRCYFFSLVTRKELKDHPLNGRTWLGTSGYVMGPDGEFIKGTATSVRIASFANLHKVIGEKEVTAADFDEPVCFKVWTGPESPPDWRKLLPKKEEPRP